MKCKGFLSLNTRRSQHSASLEFLEPVLLQESALCPHFGAVGRPTQPPGGDAAHGGCEGGCTCFLPPVGFLLVDGGGSPLERAVWQGGCRAPGCPWAGTREGTVSDCCLPRGQSRPQVLSPPGKRVRLRKHWNSRGSTWPCGGAPGAAHDEPLNLMSLIRASERPRSCLSAAVRARARGSVSGPTSRPRAATPSSRSHHAAPPLPAACSHPPSGTFPSLTF